jgi:hypothetical protein
MHDMMQKLFLLNELESKWKKEYCKSTYYSLDCLKIDEQIKEVKKEIKSQNLNIPVYI